MIGWKWTQAAAGATLACNTARLHASAVAARDHFRARLAALGVGLAAWDAAFERLPSYRTRAVDRDDVGSEDLAVLGESGAAATRADPGAHRDPEAVRRAFTYFLLRAGADHAGRVFLRGAD